MLLGYCTQCGASYESPVVTDGLCKDCRREDEQAYRNDPFIREDVDESLRWRWSRAAMRERLGVTGDVDE